MDSVMLAHKFDPDKHSEKVLGWYMSEKLDGVRAVFDGQNFITRNGKILQAPFHFAGPLEKMGKIWNGVKLDGELYMGRGKFNECSGTVRRHEDMWTDITYQVFDIITPGQNFKTRVERLWELIEMWDINHVQSVKQYEVTSLEEMLKWHDKIVNEGGEGLILKNPESFYTHNRSSDMLKVKKWQRENFKCIGTKPGKGKYVGMIGALVIESYEGSTTDVGSGLTDADRLRDPNYFIGEILDVQFFEVNRTKAERGKLRFPTYKGIRIDA